MTISDVMTTDVVTISPSQTVREAIQLLDDLAIRHLPVLSEGRLVGLISDRDLREYRLPLFEAVDNPNYASDLLQTPINEAMSGHVITIDAGEDLEVAIDLMIEYGIGAVPVIDHHRDELVGIISYVDVLKAVRPLVGD
jgi:acetoin utilization protein AcuB